MAGGSGFRAVASPRPVAIALVVALSLSALGHAQNRASAKPTPASISAPTPLLDYRIGPFDRLNITVFQVKDLTFEKLQVDAAGEVRLPLIGAVPAAVPAARRTSSPPKSPGV